MRLLFSVFSLHFLNCPYETVDFSAPFLSNDGCVYLKYAAQPASLPFIERRLGISALHGRAR